MGADGVGSRGCADLELTALVHQRQNPAPRMPWCYFSATSVENKDDETIHSGTTQAVAVDLASIGITTFASAGDDATKRKSYPAAFAVDAPFDGHGGVCRSGGGLNPNRHGCPVLQRWRLGHRAGGRANVVSTAPTRIQGGLSPAASVEVGGRVPQCHRPR